jgi:hypothetical protein
MKKYAITLLGLVRAAPAMGQVPSFREGKITRIWADPSDMVVQLDGTGPCGSDLFHILRSAANFDQMTALMMTAAAAGRPVNLYVTGCNGDRNIISHGAAGF